VGEPSGKDSLGESPIPPQPDSRWTLAILPGSLAGPAQERKESMRRAYTLIGLLVVIAIIAQWWECLRVRG
jgi:hypothetical protein